MIRLATLNDFEEILRLRKLLYFDSSEDEIAGEIYYNFRGNGYHDICVTYVYERDDLHLGGFIEIGIINEDIFRKESVKFAEYNDIYSSICNSFEKHLPISRIESWYVDEDLRGQHIGKRLMAAGENWAKQNGSFILLSDTDEFRKVSQKAHLTFGFSYIITDDEGCLYYYKNLLSNPV